MPTETFRYAANPTEHGTVHQVAAGGRTTVMHVPEPLLSHHTTGAPLTALVAGVAKAGEGVAAAVGDRTASGLHRLAISLVSQHVTPPFQSSQSAIASALDGAEERVAALRTPRFPDDVPQVIRVEQRTYARGLPLPKLLAAVADDPGLAAAVVEGGVAMSGLPADVFERLRRDVAVTNMANVLRGQRTYRVAATADAPVGGQPDEAALRAEAEAQVAAAENAVELLSGAPAVLSNVVTVVAIMCDLPRDKAFELLSGADA